MKVLKVKESNQRHSALTPENRAKLEEMMAKVNEFVYDKASGKAIVFEIDSQMLKRALERKVKIQYLKTGIFTDHDPNSNKSYVKKTRGFK